jgi:hypothetical protein
MGYIMRGHTLPGIKQRKTDPDAPGTPGTPGYEPPVESMDYLTKTPNPTTKAISSKPKPMTEEEKSADHDLWNLEDKMKDEGVFSIGGQKND